MNRRSFFKFLGGLAAAVALPTIPLGFARADSGLLIPAAADSLVHTFAPGRRGIVTQLAMWAGEGGGDVALKRPGGDTVLLVPAIQEAVYYWHAADCGFIFTPDHPLVVHANGLEVGISWQDLDSMEHHQVHITSKGVS